jgi:hypothetical protein
LRCVDVWRLLGWVFFKIRCAMLMYLELARKALVPPHVDGDELLVPACVRVC